MVSISALRLFAFCQSFPCCFFYIFLRTNSLIPSSWCRRFRCFRKRLESRGRCCIYLSYVSSWYSEVVSWSVSFQTGSSQSSWMPCPCDLFHLLLPHSPATIHILRKQEEEEPTESRPVPAQQWISDQWIPRYRSTECSYSYRSRPGGPCIRFGPIWVGQSLLRWHY